MTRKVWANTVLVDAQGIRRSFRKIKNRGSLMDPCESPGCRRHIAQGEVYYRLSYGWGPWCEQCTARIYGSPDVSTGG